MFFGSSFIALLLKGGKTINHKRETRRRCFDLDQSGLRELRLPRSGDFRSAASGRQNQAPIRSAQQRSKRLRCPFGLNRRSITAPICGNIRPVPCTAAEMSELPDTFDLEQCARYLRGLAAADSPVLPIGEAALALASFERPRVALARYRQHLDAIARDVGRHAESRRRSRRAGAGAQRDHPAETRL